MKRKIKAGTTNHMEPIRVYDSSSTTGAYLAGITSGSSGLLGRYRREGSASWTTISIVTATAGVFTSGGWAVPTSGPTSYEVHIPNAAIAAGADWVEIEYYGVANMVPVQLFFELDAVDYQDAAGFGLSRLDVATSTRLANLGTNAPANWINDAAIATAAFTSAKFAAGAFDAVWSVASRSLTSFGTLVTDIWASVSRTLTGTVTLATAQPNYAPAKAGDAMTLTSGERTAIANEVEAQIIDDTDSEKVLQAIVDKIAAANPSLDDLTLGAIASSVRTELATELARIDANISTRATQTSVDIIDDFVDTEVAATLAAANSAAASAATAVSQTTAANIRGAVGLGSANLDAQLTAKPTLAQIEGSSVLAKEATVSTRATQSSVDTKPTLAQIEASSVLAKEASVQALLSRITTTLFSGITSMGDWIRRIARKDAGTAGMTTAGTEIGGDFLGSTDSLEAIRDRGDAAWTTGAGGGGGDSVTITPEAFLNLDAELLAKNVFIHFNAENRTYSISLVEGVFDGEAMRFILNDDQGMTVFSQDNIVSTTNTALINFTPLATLPEKCGTWALRRMSDGFVYLSGPAVQRVAATFNPPPP